MWGLMSLVLERGRLRRARLAGRGRRRLLLVGAFSFFFFWNFFSTPES